MGNLRFDFQKANLLQNRLFYKSAVVRDCVFSAFDSRKLVLEYRKRVIKKTVCLFQFRKQTDKPINVNSLFFTSQFLQTNHLTEVILQVSFC